MKTTDVHSNFFYSKSNIHDEKKYPDLTMDDQKIENQQFVVPWQMSKSNERKIFAE